MKIIINCVVISIIGSLAIEIAQSMPNNSFQQGNKPPFGSEKKRRFSEGMIETNYSSASTEKKQKTYYYTPQKQHQNRQNGTGVMMSSTETSQQISNPTRNTVLFPSLNIPQNINSVSNIYEYAPQEEGTRTNFIPQQINHLDYSRSVDNNMSYSTFNASEVAEIAQQHSRMNVERLKMELYKQIINLKHQNELLRKEVQSYKEQNEYFLATKIADLRNQVTTLQTYIANQKKKQDAIKILKNSLCAEIIKPAPEVILTQQNKKLQEELQRYKQAKESNTPPKTVQLKKQLRALKHQIAEEKTKHEKEIQGLQTQLQEERDLNLLFSLGAEAQKQH